MIYDAAVIGAGVVGCAVARELSRWDLKILVLEKELDVATGNSSRNTGMLHAGFTYKNGSLKAECAVEGNQEFDLVAAELSVPFKRTGKLVVGFTDHDRENILKFRENGKRNGVKGIRMLETREEIEAIEPYAGGNFAMYVPSSGILDPMQYTIALAENAAENGASFLFGAGVASIDRPGDGDLWILHTEKGDFSSRWVINCAGAFSPMVSAMLGYPEYVTYLKDYQTDLQDIDTYVFSRFFNSKGFRTRDVEAMYKQSFNGEMLNSVPNMVLMGFDLGMYLINTLGHGIAIDSEAPLHRGVQTSFKFERANSEGGMINRAIDVVHFSTDHQITTVVQP